MRHTSKAWALLIRTPASPPANPHAQEWLAGRYCFGHEEPSYTAGLRIGCFLTRREARTAAREWAGPRGEKARPVRVTITVDPEGKEQT